MYKRQKWTFDNAKATLGTPDKVEEVDGCFWAIAGDTLIREVFHRCEDESYLDMFQAGYYPTNLEDNEGQTMWANYDS